MTRALPASQVTFLQGQQYLNGMIGPEQISAASTFLLSDEGRFMTGESVIVDAGGGLRVQPAARMAGATA
jgi:enoyl-[acyl-carrier-protein] reductase (NADH)